MIDWPVVDSFMKSLPLGKRRWCTKHASKNCGVGITLLDWDLQSDNECPRCSMPEDSTNVLRCTAQDASTEWLKGLASLIETMVRCHTPIDIQTAIVSRLQSWRENAPLLPDPTWTPALSALISSQDHIGWKAFHEVLPTNVILRRDQSPKGRCPRWIRKKRSVFSPTLQSGNDSSLNVDGCMTTDHSFHQGSQALKPLGRGILCCTSQDMGRIFRHGASWAFVVRLKVPMEQSNANPAIF